ncbi:hypothetical protein HF325_000264 [Metschnikowia pulcherrima]|uniref:Hpc2-related domain-containing protein n=1 Tax=Metschnikowia pulcherrima TaxID=27326 RepID=A0A8H7GY03_9ASCO|nr:hypothetical protein HF325_000264 [Metschnikowia pulcherrima]
MTTEKSKYTGPPASVPAPSFIAMEEPGLGDVGNDEKEKLQLPVIALDVPLLDPKNPRPGQAEVVVNVMRLAEEKYGWAAVHPEARSTFDLMEDVLDDEEDGDEEEDEEVMIVDEKGNALKKKDDGGDKKKKKVPPKVNRKVGKYDFEDPFIDDAELQWEEEITTTKEGFFVYWGPWSMSDSPRKKAVLRARNRGFRWRCILINGLRGPAMARIDGIVMVRILKITGLYLVTQFIVRKDNVWASDVFLDFVDFGQRWIRQIMS